ncbi:MAG: Flp family type IVb pilin [Polyangiales bacterium]
MKEARNNHQASQRSLAALRDDTRGAGLVEYIILIGLIALLAIAGFNQFGTAVNQKAIDLGTQVSNIGAGGGN